MLTFCLLWIDRHNQKNVFILIESVTIWVSSLYAITELLSLFCAVDKKCLTTFWTIYSAILIIMIFKKKGSWSNPFHFWKIKRNELALVLIIIFIAIGVGILAICTVPYNWDSMTYHLARIAHWKENASIAHYTTPEIRQLTSPPLAEIVNLHVYILYNATDNILNLLQYFSYIISAILVYGISRKLKISKICSLVGTLLFMSMPIAFGEAISTQVDEFATIWLLSFVYMVIDFTDNKISFSKEYLGRLTLIGLVAGYSYLAKPSVLLAECVFTVWVMLYQSIKRKNFISSIFAVGYSIFIAVTISLPEMIRNILTFGAISDPQAGARQLVGTFNPLYLIVNACKNIADNLVNVYFNNSSFLLSKCVFKLASLLGVRINDPSISEDGNEYIINTVRNYSHDSAANTVIIIMFFAIVLYIMFHLKYKKINFKDNKNVFFIFSGISFIGFSLLVRWEPYVSRYMLGYLAILCPAIAGQLNKIKNKSVGSYYSFLSILILLCIIDLYGMFCYHGGIVLSQINSINHSDGYFVYKKGSISAYDSVTNSVEKSGFASIGLEVESNSYEYPIWAMLSNDNIHIESFVEIDNITSKYDDKSFFPDCIITIDHDKKDSINYHGNVYLFDKMFDDEAIIYVKE